LEAKNSGTPPRDSLQQAIQVSGEFPADSFSSEQDEVFGVSMLFSPDRLSPEILLLFLLLFLISFLTGVTFFEVT
jgi:hypothetical protein